MRSSMALNFAHSAYACEHNEVLFVHRTFYQRHNTDAHSPHIHGTHTRPQPGPSANKRTNTCNALATNTLTMARACICWRSSIGAVTWEPCARAFVWVMLCAVYVAVHTHHDAEDDGNQFQLVLMLVSLNAMADRFEASINNRSKYANFRRRGGRGGDERDG